MPDNIILEHLLLLDIETVALSSDFNGLPPLLQELWMGKFTKTAPEMEDGAKAFEDRAGIYAEFGKIICISVGYFYKEGEGLKLKIKSFAGDDEKEVLKGFFQLAEKFYYQKKRFDFAGHNIREFDIPFICRRSVIHQLELPPVLQINGLKPWEMPIVDTLHLWRFGDHRHYTSLELLTAVLDVPNPKEIIEGSDVSRVYWQVHGLEMIVDYCQRDVAAVAQLLLRFKRIPLLSSKNIIIVN